MATLTASTLRTRLKAGKLPPVLVLVGDDEVEKSDLVSALCATVDEELQAFNVQRIYADTDGAPALAVGSARTIPMLGDRRIVLLLRAERLFKKASRKAEVEPGDAPAEEEATHPDLEVLAAYIAEPEPTTCLAVVGADINRATRLGKALVKHADIVECWGLKPSKDGRPGDMLSAALSKAAALIKDRVAAAGLTTTEDAILPLLEHCGTNISVLRGDLDKLMLYCAGRRTMTRADVLEVVGGAVSLDDWAMTRAIERAAPAAALRELALALEGGAVPYMVLGQLAWLVRSVMPRLAPDRVGRAIEAVFRADAAIKTSGGDPRVVLERLVVELCGPPVTRRPTAWSGSRR